MQKETLGGRQGVALRRTSSLRLRAARLWVGLTLATSSACGNGEKNNVGPTPPIPADPGSIAGLVAVAGGTAGFGAAPVVLRRATGDSLTAALTDSLGRFRFAGVAPGAYRVSVRLRAGFRADMSTDTAQQVSVASRVESTVQLTARPVLSVSDTVRAGRADTVTLGNGARLSVALPDGAAATTLQFRAAPGDSASWGTNLVGPAAEVVFPATTPGTIPALDTATLVFQLPITAGGASEERTVRVLYLDAAGDTIAIDGVSTQLVASQNAITGQNQSAVTGRIPLRLQGTITTRLAPVPITTSCASQGSLDPVAGFQGAEPLVLVHGLQVGYGGCLGFPFFDPTRQVFRSLIADLLSDTEIRSRYKVFTYRYPTNYGIANAATTLGNANHLPNVVKAAGVRATIIAHSMGGLVARQYVRNRGADEIGHVITLATPHLGSSVADAGAGILVHPGVGACYSQLRQFPNTLTLPSYSVLFTIGPTALLASWPGTQAFKDLTAVTPVLGVTEPDSPLFTTFYGHRPAQPVRHGYATDLFYALAGCYLSTSGFAPNDGVVGESSARPPWSRRAFGPYARDHSQMAGNNASGVNDTFLADLKALLLPSTISITSNVATSWTLNPGGLTGSGTSGTIAVRPIAPGTVYTLTPQPLPGRSVTVGNSLGGGSAITLFPGNQASFTITYSGGGVGTLPSAPTNLNGSAASGFVSLVWSDNSSNESSFAIERATGASGAFAPIGSTGQDVAAFVDRSVTPGTTYRYRVAAVNASGTSVFSNIISVTAPAAPGGCSPPVPVPVNLGSGPITWSPAQAGCDHYVLRGAVVSFADLTILPGTRIVADAGASLDIRGGSIRAVGTSTGPIVFSALNPVRGAWRGIRIDSPSTANELAWVTVAHAGGSAFSGPGATPANLYVEAFAQVRVSNSSFEESAAVGMNANGSAELPGFSSNRFVRNDDVGLRLGSDVLRFADNASDYTTGNGQRYLDVVPRGSLNGQHRWRVTTIPHRFNGATVSFGDITIDPGVRVEFSTAASLDVRGGSILGIGTQSQRIVFSGVTPVPGSWMGVQISTSSPRNELAWIDISHAGRTSFSSNGLQPANLAVAAFASLRLSNARITNGAGAGLHAVGDATLPGFANNSFTGNADVGVRTAPDLLHYLDDASDYRTRNGKSYVDVIPRSSIDRGPRRWLVTSTPIRFSGVTVSFADISIDPGVVVQFAISAKLDIRASLRAVGTSTRRIVFEGESPTAGSWAGIHFTSGQSSLNELSFVDVTHGGRTSSGTALLANVVVENFQSLRVSESRITDSAGWGLFAESKAILLPANPRAQGNNQFGRNSLGDVNR